MGTAKERVASQNKQICIKFSAVGPDDLRWVLRMISDKTGWPTVSFEESDFERLRQDFMSGRGLASLQIRAYRTTLDLTRIIDKTGEPYARVNIVGSLPAVGKYTQAEMKDEVQKELDDYFEKKGGVPLHTLIPRTPY